MNLEAEQLSAELRDELASNAFRRKWIEPSSVPVRFSYLKAIGQSAAHCLETIQDDRDDTMSIRLGRGTHALLLGTPVVSYPGIRRGKAWDAFRVEHGDATILSGKEYSKAHAIAEAVRNNETAHRLLYSPGVVREKTIEFNWLGRKCRATPDARSTYSLVELKTTKCAHPDRFARDATFRAYHAQAAFYGIALAETVGVKPQDSYVIAVESAAPYAVTVLRLTARALEQGERLCRLWMERFKVCEDSRTWPAYAESIVPFDVPEDEPELIFGETKPDESDD